MRVIFFPFTYINNIVAEALNSCFGQINVYQPSSLDSPAIMNDTDLINIRTPVTGDEDVIKRIIQDFKAWGDIHRNDEMEMFKIAGTTIPFFDDNSINQIRADITKGLSNPAEKEEDPLLNARIFLYFAQEFDKQNNDINQELFLCEELEQKFISDLMGPDKNNAAKNKIKQLLPNNSDDFLMKQRINAWSRLFMHERESAPLFITTSRQAIEYLMDKDGGFEKILTINADEPELGNFLDNIDDMAGKVWKPSTTILQSPQDADSLLTEISNKLTFYIIPDKTPHEFFAGCADIDISGIDLSEENKRVRNTILGLYQKSYH